MQMEFVRKHAYGPWEQMLNKYFLELFQQKSANVNKNNYDNFLKHDASDLQRIYFLK